MKAFFFCFIVFLFGTIQAQTAGNWKGVLYFDGQKISAANLIYFEIPSGSNGLNGKTREEVAGKDAFVVKKTTCAINKYNVVITQQTVEKKKDAVGNRWCNAVFSLTYNDSTGYLTGTFISSECNGKKGTIICIRSTESFDKSPTNIANQSWLSYFIDDIQNKRKAPEIRAKERANFVFQPIFFDVDQAEIKNEFMPFLDKMVAVVLGHSDLRIMVIGHTDADGSASYNIALSERRALAIIDYFVCKGLSRDRIKIQFKGETEPIGDNKTVDGKQLNRRVDFLFI